MKKLLLLLSIFASTLLGQSCISIQDTVYSIGNPNPIPMTGSIRITLGNILADGTFRIVRSVTTLQIRAGVVNVCLPTGTYKWDYTVTNPGNSPSAYSTYVFSPNYGGPWKLTGVPTGVVNTTNDSVNGSTVSWVSGLNFGNVSPTDTIQINGTNSTINTINSAVSLVTSNNYGVLTGVSFTDGTIEKEVAPPTVPPTIAGPPGITSPPSGPCGGDLSGSFPNCVVSKVNGGVIPNVPFAAINSSGQITGAAYTPVNTASNLSDLASASAARTNLGLAPIASSGSASDLSSGTLPAGREPVHTNDVTNSAGSLALTVVSVGGSSASAVHTGEQEANGATSSNTASAGVRRDSSGNFFAGSIRGTDVFATNAQTAGTIQVYPPNLLEIDKDNPDAPLQFEVSYCSTDSATCDIPSNGTRVDVWYRPTSGANILYYGTCTPNPASPECKAADWHVVGPATLPAGDTATFNYVYKIGGTKYWYVAGADGNGYEMTNPSGDGLTFVAANSGNPIITKSATTTDWYYSIYNVGIAVNGTTCYAAIEGQQQGDNAFHIGYSYGSCAGGVLNLNTNITATSLITPGGNAQLRYNATNNGLIVIYGGAIDGTQITMSTCPLASGPAHCSVAANWTTPKVALRSLDPQNELADPEFIFNLGSPAFPWWNMLGFTYHQLVGYQAFGQMNEDEMYAWAASDQNVYGNQQIISGSVGIDGVHGNLFSVRPGYNGVAAQPSIGLDGVDALSINTYSGFKFKAAGTTVAAMNGSGAFTQGIWQATPVGSNFGGTGTAGTLTGVPKAQGASAWTNAAFADLPGPTTGQIPYGSADLLTSNSSLTWSAVGLLINGYDDNTKGLTFRSGIAQNLSLLVSNFFGSGTTMQYNGYTGHEWTTNNGAIVAGSFTPTGTLNVGAQTTSLYGADINRSGSAGTLQVYDTTPSTGVTFAKIKAGAGQSTSDLFDIQANNGSNLFKVGPDGTITTTLGQGVVQSSSAGVISLASIPSGQLVFGASGGVGSTADLTYSTGTSGAHGVLVAAYPNCGYGYFLRDASVNPDNMALRSTSYFAGGCDGVELAGYRGIHFAVANNAAWMDLSAAGVLTVGANAASAYQLEVTSSNGVGTARFFDQTATTGATRVQVSLGAADTTNTVTLVNQGTTKSANFTGDGSLLTGLNASSLMSGTVPPTRLPNPSATTLGGVESVASITHQFLTGISTSGVPAQAQPSAADISGLGSSATTTNVCGKPEDYGGGIGSADNHAAILSANSAWGCVQFSYGTYISSPISLSTMVMYGLGPNTVLQMKAGTTGCLLTAPGLSIVQSMILDGGISTTQAAVSTSPANRSGLCYTSQIASTFSGLIIRGFGLYGIVATDGAPSSNYLRQQAIISDISLYNNWIDMFLPPGAEFSQFSNINLKGAWVGAWIQAGVIDFTGSSSVSNGTGVQIDGLATSSNPGHGSWTGGQIAHNVNAVVVVDNDSGFRFTSVDLAYGNFRITNSSGVQVTDSRVAGNVDFQVSSTDSPCPGGGCVSSGANLIADNYFNDSTKIDNNYGSGGVGKLVLSGNFDATGTDPLCTTSTGGSFSCNTVGPGSLNVVLSSSTPAFDLSLGQTQRIAALGANATMTVSNIAIGVPYTFQICQDITGSRTFTWSAAFHGVTAIGSTASLCSQQTFVSTDGSTLYATATGVVNQ